VQQVVQPHPRSDPAQPAVLIDRLTAGVAHDFNNLLTIVLGHATALRVSAESQGDAQASRRAGLIEQAAERGGRLANQLLAYARQQFLQAEDIRLGPLLSELHTLMAHAAGDHVRLRTTCAPRLWRCHADPAQLESALLNLVLNAREAMPDGGSISIHASNQSVTPLHARTVGGQSGDYIRIEVCDTGGGIPTAIQHRVFEPFFTTKPVGKGSGLGLAQVQGFAGQSGGWVELRSRLNDGTCIALVLPRARRMPAGGTTQRQPSVRRILVITSDLAVFDTLDDAGYEVLAADDQAAAQIALQAPHAPDVLLVDLVMPDGGSGLVLAQEARRQWPNLPVVLTAASARDLAPNMQVTEFALLPKPYQPDELLRVLDALFCERLFPADTETILTSLRERPQFDQPAYVAGALAPASLPDGDAIRLGVMPIRCLANTPEADLATGLAEEISGALSRFRSIACVAPASIAAVAAEKFGATLRWQQLDLHFVLEATLQRNQQQLRLTVRLIDLRNNAEVVWGRSFDGTLTDLMELQARIAAETVAQVAPEVLLWAGDNLAARPSADPNAYQLMLRAIPAIYRLDRTGFEAAGALLQESVRLDPGNAPAHSWLAHWYLLQVGQGWAVDVVKAAQAALRHAERAMGIDPEDARGLTTAGHIHAFLSRAPAMALELHARALAINPNLPMAWCYRGLAHSYLGQHLEAVHAIQQALSLSPFDPHAFFFETALIMPYLLTGQYEQAAQSGRRALRLHPGLSSTHKGLLSALGHLGLAVEAATIRQHLLELEPGFTVREAMARSPLQNVADLACYAEGLRRAGLPEGAPA
jgi:TolB-like protein